ncbi:MAG: hypothetical protein E7527_02025 [Ruminococcaceae bacterium]|nr:hypothetical protein [Oscillospiraceae bacterium]
MIKGVNRQMIEVTHTGSPYFERAFLVVRAGGQPPTQERLQRQAEKVVEQAGTYAGLRRQTWLRRGKTALFGFFCAGGGAILTWGLERWLG